jgi:type IV pilus assembly protein PilM
MLERLWKKTDWPIALDFGADSVKMLQLQETSGGIGVRACGRWQCSEPDAQDPEQRRRLVIAAVRNLLRSGGFRGRNAVSALPYRDIRIKNVRLPHIPEHEMAKAVQWEAREQFPFDVAENQLHYINAGQVRAGNELRDEIIMLAAPAEVVEERLSLLSEMDLTPIRIEAEPVALLRMHTRLMRRSADDEAVSVLVDLGGEGTRVVVARGSSIVFIKDIGTGGGDITTAVAKQLNLSAPEALELRMRPGQSEDSSGDESAPESTDRNSLDWTIHDAIRGVVESLAKEVSLCLRYCSVTFRGLRPQAVTLTGGGALDPLLVKLLGEHLNVACEVELPLRGMELSGAGFEGNRRGTLADWALCAGMGSQDATTHSTQEVQDDTHRLSA